MSRLAPLCLFAFSTVAGAAPPAAPDAGIDGLMQRYDGRVPGAAVLVLKDGQPVFRRGYGLAVLEDGTPVSPATNFRLASVSKQFTAAAILLLAEDGALSIDDPLKKWLPELPAVADAMTLRQLLSHSSGLLDYEDLMDPADTRQVHDIDVLHLLQKENRTYFAPGSSYRYSNSGYALLALVVGKASGSDFASFLRQRIFLPLGMTATFAHQDGVDEVPERAYGYSQIDGHWQRTDQSTTSAVLGDGGIYSSIDDLAKWDAALYDERLLRRASLQQAFSAATATPEPDVPHYGFGWRINGDALWHSGESIGFRNVIVRYPKQKLTVVVLSNRNDPEPYALALQIARRWQAPQR
ncbi:beta-lactamase family protein [Stenotrophomonas acidaminiphila]|uniref:serine hydrolase domain-containing protein n=1 Tax=Stenotrophomonas acidaminiphila TaxID=128780 RepID=UPI000CF58008|nr:serine hydrolase domain-containing protein [Stenotrophomonas acidaminiphila]NCT86464.1 beta-lactamase family protein [Stenotrophomonas acidaminiphila]WPU54892.1 serine hydrolase domain-containing protein [Stenotrophomonas acidaminiphila]